MASFTYVITHPSMHPVVTRNPSRAWNLGRAPGAVILAIPVADPHIEEPIVPVTLTEDTERRLAAPKLSWDE